MTFRLTSLCAAVLITAAVASPALARGPAPQLSVRPSTARVGTTILVRGSHLNPNVFMSFMLLVTVSTGQTFQRFVGKPARTNGSGVLSTSIPIPRLSVCGRAWIVAYGGHRTQTPVTARFNLTGCKRAGTHPKPPPAP